MLTIFNTKHITWIEDEKTSLNYYELWADTTDDIPSDLYCFSSEEKGRYKISQGSMIYIIADGSMYALKSDGTWELQVSGGSGSGFEPTTEQLAAMNSGITSAYVTQIGTNTNDISTLQQTIGDINTALTNINTALGGVI